MTSKKGRRLVSGSHIVHPVWTRWQTLVSTGSFSVHDLICEAMTMLSERWFRTKFMSQRIGTDKGYSGSGRRLKGSTLAILVPGLCWMVYWYADNIKAHRCILEDDITRTWRNLLRRRFNGWWSEYNVNGLPYWWNHLQQKQLLMLSYSAENIFCRRQGLKDEGNRFLTIIIHYVSKDSS